MLVNYRVFTLSINRYPRPDSPDPPGTRFHRLNGWSLRALPWNQPGLKRGWSPCDMCPSYIGKRMFSAASTTHPKVLPL